jgi:ABC-type nitrate/sulfonate/bicarbonate transport system ATPase subunit
MLSIKNLYIKYHNTGKVVLGDVSLDVSSGDRIAVLGPSGCGKSTLLSVVAGLLTKKDVEMAGEMIFAGGERPKTRTVFQSPVLLPWRNVLKNVMFGLEMEKIYTEKAEKMAREALNIVGLSGFEKYYPDQLSLGMQQRVNFARALVCEPDILLLDEPFSALDTETKQSIQESFLDTLKKTGATAIFVTHNLEEAFYIGTKIVIFSKCPSCVKIEINNTSSGDVPENLLNKLDYYEN